MTIGGRGSNGTALRFTVMPIVVEAILGLLAVEVRLAEVDEREVHVGAAREDVHAVPGLEQLLGDGLRAVDRALLALAERVRRGDLQRDRLARDHVLERAALLAGEHGRVDLLGVLLARRGSCRRGRRRSSCGSSS